MSNSTIKTQGISIGGRKIGPGHPVYVIAELSANHNQNFEEAKRLVLAAKEVGADAVKLQTYTPDTITIDCDSDLFQIKSTIWAGKTLHKLYGEAYTPWDWQPKLKELADSIGLALFSSPFDNTAVDFLEKMNVPAYKIASFENIDIPLIRYVAAKGKPVIISTGMANEAEVSEAVAALREAGTGEIALLKCTSAYPAPPEEMNLKTIPYLAQKFGVCAGLSDHSLGIEAAVTSVALGACIIEKHFTLDRNVPGPDSAFSLEPREFKAMIDAVRFAEKSLGSPTLACTAREEASKAFRRSLFFVEDIAADETITERHVRSIRPANGLAPKFLTDIIGRKAAQSVKKGTPVAWELIKS